MSKTNIIFYVIINILDVLSIYDKQIIHIYRYLISIIYIPYLYTNFHQSNEYFKIKIYNVE